MTDILSLAYNKTPLGISDLRAPYFVEYSDGSVKSIRLGYGMSGKHQFKPTRLLQDFGLKHKPSNSYSDYVIKKCPDTLKYEKNSMWGEFTFRCLSFLPRPLHRNFDLKNGKTVNQMLGGGTKFNTLDCSWSGEEFLIRLHNKETSKKYIEFFDDLYEAFKKFDVTICLAQVADDNGNPMPHFNIEISIYSKIINKWIKEIR